MSITIQCQCSRVITVSVQLAGQTTRCPSCGRRHLIPTNLPEPTPVVEQAEVAPAFDGECRECATPMLADSAYCHGCGLPREEAAVEPSPEPEPQRAVPPVAPLRIPAADASAAPAAPPIVSARPPRETASPFQPVAATNADRAASPTVPGPDGPFARASHCRTTRERAQAVASSPDRDGCFGPFRAERAEANGTMRPNGFGRVGMTFAVMAMIAGTFMLVFACPVLKRLGNGNDRAQGSDAIESEEIRVTFKSSRDVVTVTETEAVEDVEDVEVIEVDEGERRFSTKPGKIEDTTIQTEDANANADATSDKLCTRGECPVATNDEAATADNGKRCRIGKLTAAQAVNLCYGLGVLSLGFAVLGALCGFIGALQWRRPKAQAVWAVILCSAVFVMVSPAMDRVAEVRADMKAAPSVGADDGCVGDTCVIRFDTCGQSCTPAEVSEDKPQTEGEIVRDETLNRLTVDPSVADDAGTTETEPRD